MTLTCAQGIATELGVDLITVLKQDAWDRNDMDTLKELEDMEPYLSGALSAEG